MPRRISTVLLSLTALSALFLLANLESRAELEASGSDRKDPVLLYREAGASQEQEVKIRQYAQEYEKAARVRLERLQNLSQQIRDLSFEPEIDETKILAAQDEYNQLQSGLASERIKLMLKIRSLLSAEQKTKLVELMKEKDKQSLPADKKL